MSSSLKVLGLLLILLLTLCGLFFQTQNPSWRDFMKQHHLSSSLAFSEYRCNDLMREREAPKDKNYHIFIYTLWHKIKHMCFRNRRDRYRNAYMWAQYPFKILKCYLENNKKSYKEQRSYSYIEFHCGLNGFVDSIEDIRLLYVISN